MTIIGTSYFMSVAAACGYYKPYEPCLNPTDLARHVLDKIHAGEIHIGKPSLKPGETLSLIDSGTRYAITEI